MSQPTTYLHCSVILKFPSFRFVSQERREQYRTELQAILSIWYIHKLMNASRNCLANSPKDKCQSNC